MKETSSSHLQTTVKNTSIFSFFTIISRVLGLLRDMLKAYAFGTGIASVAFDIAFRLPNMFRNLVAEGALSQAFVPIYQQYHDSHDSYKERLAFGNVLLVVFFILLLFTVVVIVFLPQVLPLLIGQSEHTNEITRLSVPLSQILFPYILLMSLASLYMSVQYSYQSFVAASFGPALLNSVILIFFSVYYFFIFPHRQTWEHEAIYVFSFVTLLAAVVQVFFQALAVKRMQLSPILQFRKKHPVVKNLFVMMLPAVFGASVQELGQLIDIVLATKLYKQVPEAVSALTYAHRLIQLPIGIFGVAIATATLPQLSRIFLEGNKRQFSEALLDSIALNLFLLLPATLGLVFFATPIVGFIFEHGEFTARSTEVSATAVVFYAPGIVAFGLQKLFMNSLYARRNSKTPAWITLFALIVNVSLSLYFMQFLLHAGLALSSSLSAFFAVLVYFFIYVKTNMFEFDIFKKKLMAFIKIIFVNILFALVLWLVSEQVKDFRYFIQVLCIVPLVLVYAFFAVLFRLHEWLLFWQMMQKIKKKFLGTNR